MTTFKQPAMTNILQHDAMKTKKISSSRLYSKFSYMLVDKNQGQSTLIKNSVKAACNDTRKKIGRFQLHITKIEFQHMQSLNQPTLLRRFAIQCHTMTIKKNAYQYKDSHMKGAHR